MGDVIIEIWRIVRFDIAAEGLLSLGPQDPDIRVRAIADTSDGNPLKKPRNQRPVSVLGLNETQNGLLFLAAESSDSEIEFG